MYLIKKEVILLFLILLLSQQIYAQDLNLNAYDNLELDVEITSGINIEYLSNDYDVDYVASNLSIFPRDNNWQEIINKELISNPEINPIEQENSIYYKWYDPSKTKLEFGYNSVVKTKTNFKKVKDKIKFPLNIDYYKEFTLPTITITSEDPLIAEKAAELAEGEDDLYVVVHKLSAWTKENIDYSLETLTAEVSQTASWVFENKRGVCDELTALFIAMLRSLDIPARVVIGSSYTNVNNNFGNHAWAEVYFPDYGWIAFDPTYGQLGYVDASHVKMKDSLDIKGSSIEYSWRARNIDVESDGIDIRVSALKTGDLFKEDLDMGVELLKDNVNSGSYVPIQVNLKNLNDYYLPLTLFITKAPAELADNLKHVLLKPEEEKSVFFLIPIPENLERGYIYTSTIEVTNNFNDSSSQMVHYSNINPSYTLEEAQNKINQLKKEEEKVYSSAVDLSCNLDKPFYYEDEIAIVNCTIANKGNTNLKDIEICAGSNCDSLDLRITEEDLVAFDIDLEVGVKELIVSAENEKIAKSNFLDLNVFEKPDLKITNLDYSENINYKDTYKMTFNLDTKSEISNVAVKISNDKRFDLDKFDGKDQFVVPFKGNFFYKIKEPKIHITYEDKNNEKYELKEPLTINVINIPFYIQFWWILLIIVLVAGFFLTMKIRKH